MMFLKNYVQKDILILLLFVCSVYTQTTKLDEISDSKTYFNFGVGLSDVKIIDWYGKPSFGIGFNYVNSNHLIKSRYYYCELNSFMAEVPVNIWDFGILYGYCKNFNFTSMSFSAGIGFVNYSYAESIGLMTYDRKNIFTIGFPFELEFNWLPSPKYGIGISIFGDINSEMSFYGVLLNFSFGKVR